MGMRSTKDEEKSLFISIKDDGGARAYFDFHIPHQVEQEARNTITILSIMLEHICRARIWTWLANKAKAETCSWVYNTKQGHVVSPNKMYTMAMITNWDWDNDSIEKRTKKLNQQYQNHVSSLQNSTRQTRKNNHYNDNGPVKMFMALFKDTETTTIEKVEETNNNAVMSK
jgi:hypothetical protein